MSFDGVCSILEPLEIRAACRWLCWIPTPEMVGGDQRQCVLRATIVRVSILLRKQTGEKL